MSKKKRKILNRSLNWIRDHLHATNLDVPDEFIAEWIFEDDNEEPRPAGFFLAVFAFGYMQGELLNSSIPPSTPRSLPVDRLMQHFGMWQMKLALAEIHRHSDIQIDPMPLFAFPEGEQVKYWPRSREIISPADAAGSSPYAIRTDGFHENRQFKRIGMGALGPSTPPPISNLP